MNVQHEQLKNLMVRDKIFLKELYEGNDLEQKRRILNFSSDSKVASRYIDRTLYFFSYPTSFSTQLHDTVYII